MGFLEGGVGGCGWLVGGGGCVVAVVVGNWVGVGVGVAVEVWWGGGDGGGEWGVGGVRWGGGGGSFSRVVGMCAS